VTDQVTPEVYCGNAPIVAAFSKTPVCCRSWGQWQFLAIGIDLTVRNICGM
jgi:hypothetical protein